MYTINGLQCVCDVLFENPSWTIAHLMAFFNLKEHLNHPKLADIIDDADYETRMTPIQVSLFSCPVRSTQIEHLWVATVTFFFDLWIRFTKHQERIETDRFHSNALHCSEFVELLKYVTNEMHLDQNHVWIRLQLAIKKGHLEMIKLLLPLCNFNHLDVNSNSLYHYAAPTTKEIINVSSV